MSKRLFFSSILTAAVVAGLVVACQGESEAPVSTSDDDGGGGDAALALADGSSGDSRAPEDSSSLDAPATEDAPFDAAEAGPPSPPPLCKTYPDTDVMFEGELVPRWLAIAFRALELGSADCAIKSSFSAYIGPGSSNPLQRDCLAFELRAVAGCLGVGGSPVVYDATSKDGSFDACLPAIKIGFKNANPSAKDVERFITRLREAALEIGLAAADAARFEALLLAKKATAVTSASTGYTDSACDGGI